METNQLYHYCSNQSLISIVKSSSIRLCSLKLSNDSLEGKLATKLLIDLATEHKLPEEKIKLIEQAFLILDNFYDGFGFCLSEKPDLLSQWRGYADDGKGVCIGFSKSLLESFEGTLLNKVEYAHNEHEKIITPLFSEIFKLINDGHLNYPSRGGLLTTKSDDEFELETQRFQNANNQLMVHAFSLFPKLYSMKSDAFSEEKEWRIFKLMEKEFDECDFFARSDHIVPFTALTLPSNCIEKIILGPKNRTPPDVLKNMLTASGFTETEIHISKNSYR